MRGFLAVLLCGFLPSLVLAQITDPRSRLDTTQPISLDAETSELDRRTNRVSFTGLRITQGALTINADNAEADRLDFEDTRWNFSGNVRIALEESLLQSDEATLTFVSHRLTHAIARGNPATFEDRRPESPVPMTGRAREVEYDLDAGVIRLIRDARISEGDNEISGASLIYDVGAERVRAEGDGEDERVRITIVPPTGDAETIRELFNGDVMQLPEDAAERLRRERERAEPDDDEAEAPPEPDADDEAETPPPEPEPDATTDEDDAETRPEPGIASRGDGRRNPPTHMGPETR